ncbi:MAG TPA: hypothetical protein VF381_15630 [Thermoanaerobaculia bacterium]
MTKKYASERAAALIHQAIDVLKHAEDSPDSPVNPSGLQLAKIYERTALRDEILEKCGGELKKITFELGTVMEQEGADAVAKTFDTIYRQTEAQAKLHGPGSEAAQRLPLIQVIVTVASKNAARARRQKGSPWTEVKSPLSKNRKLQRLMELTAAKILDAAPAKEPVIAIPAEDSGSGRERLLIRIGLRELSWVGSFEQGNTGGTAVQLMPDGRLFVAACGAGYILDLKSRTLVEKIGDEVMTVGRDDSGSLFIVNHDEKSFECFGPSGRLWKTPSLGCGGFRRLTIEGDEFIGEARQASEPEWAAFKVKLGTGRVSHPAFGVL